MTPVQYARRPSESETDFSSLRSRARGDRALQGTQIVRKSTETVGLGGNHGEERERHLNKAGNAGLFEATDTPEVESLVGSANYP